LISQLLSEIAKQQKHTDLHVLLSNLESSAATATPALDQQQILTEQHSHLAASYDPSDLKHSRSSVNIERPKHLTRTLSVPEMRASHESGAGSLLEHPLKLTDEELAEQNMQKKEAEQNSEFEEDSVSLRYRYTLQVNGLSCADQGLALAQ
jgi:hypothetical protein